MEFVIPDFDGLREGRSRIFALLCNIRSCYRPDDYLINALCKSSFLNRKSQKNSMY